jgi:NAD(P)-dependent dehydrogenase (short-subunit alcohol dehydrogenase family)
MLLSGKVAILYGAGGSVGAAIAQAFAAEGAVMVLAGRRQEPLDAVKARIISADGKAECHVLDALDAAAVDAFARDVFTRHGHIDVSFNLIGYGDVQGQAVTAMPLDLFMQPIDLAVRSHVITARAAARHMQPGGVILALTANCGRQPYPNTGGFGVACAAIEALCRQLATELGPDGIAVRCMMSAGSPDSAGVSEVFDLHARLAGITRAEMDRRAGEGTMLRHLPGLAEVADIAVMLASDRARAMTATITNVTCGQIAD